MIRGDLSEISSGTEKNMNPFIRQFGDPCGGIVHDSDPTKGMYDDESIEKTVNNAGMKLVTKKKCGLGQKVFVIPIPANWIDKD